MPARIAFVSAEMTPFAKAGGLADVSGALVKYLHADGHDIRLFMPAYSSIALAQLDAQPVEYLQDIPLQLGAVHYVFSVLTARLPQSAAYVYLIDCPACYQRPGIYTTDADEYRRFLLLTHAAFLCCQRMGFAPQIMHFNDWHTAVGPMLLRAMYSWDQLFGQARSVMTVHNIGYQGIIGAAAVGEVLPSGPTSMLHQQELREGRINLLRHGLMHADLITTVSPTYAREIRTPEYGMGLDDTLRARADELVGILNGVDYDEWNPRRDKYLPRHYTANQLGIKTSLKEEFLKRLGLTHAARTPLIGMIGRLAEQKGIDLLFEALPRLLATREFNLAVLGSGEARYEQFFTGLQRDFPTRLAFYRGFNDELAHWIEAASDLFLMPSRYEPCGLNQLYSLRYGTVPVVRRTGGLADSVQHFDPLTGHGTGVLFNDYDSAAVIWAVDTALDLYANKGLWRRLVQNAMAADFSWNRQIKLYLEEYQRLAR
ncbi:MAG: glycogen synthase [Steroidobacterales bacterium]